jgi:hypothetical protein
MVGSPQEVQFLAYDIHKPRLEFLNQFFLRKYPNARAIHQDILAEPPQHGADCIFFFKEAHRFEKRKPGCPRPVFRVIARPAFGSSLPASDLRAIIRSKTTTPSSSQRQLPAAVVDVEKIQVVNELLFVIRKERSQI